MKKMALTTSRPRLHPTQARRQTRTHTSAHTLKHACTGKLTHTRIGVNPGWVTGVTTPNFGLVGRGCSRGVRGWVVKHAMGLSVERLQ